MAFLKLEQPLKTDKHRLLAYNIRKLCASFWENDLQILEKEVKHLCNMVGIDLLIGSGNGHIWIHEPGNPKRLAIITLKRLEAYVR